ncbi:hypothetical protein [Armatimonas sp.]|uniref:hypothetical protein n=1 Tax=Armatimonas sp. TaxID=1872638 RepID=UPI0037513520
MIFVLTIAECQRDELGLYLLPGLAMEELDFRPELKRLKPGELLELRFPSGTTLTSELLAFGIPARRLQDGTALVSLTDSVHLTISYPFAPGALPAGTELWWLREGEHSEF